MLCVHTFPLGDYQSNTYFVHEEGSRQCLIIDAGYEPDTIVDKLNEQHLEPQAILLTHGHFDHVGAVRELVTELDCPVYLCPEDLKLPPMMTAGPLYYTDAYDEGSVLHLAGLTVEVLRTPGHTPGSVCLKIQDALFTGDTLFAGSCGRTDFPGSSPADMQTSLRRLAQLEGDYRVFPGHCGSSTLEQERQKNPYLH